jgi:hypothetical protein
MLEVYVISVTISITFMSVELVVWTGHFSNNQIAFIDPFSVPDYFV